MTLNELVDFMFETIRDNEWVSYKDGYNEIRFTRWMLKRRLKGLYLKGYKMGLKKALVVVQSGPLSEVEDRIKREVAI